MGCFTPQGNTLQFLRANSPDQGIDAEWQPDGRLLQLSQTFPTQDRAAAMARDMPLDGVTITNINTYEYTAAGQLAAITYLRSINPTSGISRTTFCYYGENEEHGTVGDLKTSTDQLLVGTTWIDHKTHYCRYYRAGESGGFAHGLKYALGPEAFERLRQDPQVANPFLATDTQVAQYADFFYVYDEDQRVVQSTTQAGLLIHTFSYETRDNSSDTENLNHWVLKITTTAPDGSQTMAFNNFLGQTLLRDQVSGSDHWIDYYQFDENARETLHASPAAVISYNAADADLSVVLRSHTGLMDWTDYYTETTATPTVPGGVAGYVQSHAISAGQAGDRVLQSTITYIQRVAGVATIYPVAESTQYRQDDGTGAITTRYAYTWFDDTAQMEQRTR
ncbi:MAG: hypothetical protein LC104_10410 [Bacteroidales bacterium]|nr:hypothetical protein [Bacteroidales bacterium]